MSTHPGREKRPNKLDFSQMTIEEQKKYWEVHGTEDKDLPFENEKIAEEAKKQMDKFRTEHIT